MAFAVTAATRALLLDSSATVESRLVAVSTTEAAEVTVIAKEPAVGGVTPVPKVPVDGATEMVKDPPTVGTAVKVAVPAP